MALKSTRLLAGIAAIAFVAVAAYVFYKNMDIHQTLSELPVRQITLGTQVLSVEVASTESQREQGLSGRDSLADGKGMLFVFDTDGNWGIWMKDMRFSIDILFLDAQGSVLSVNGSVSPKTYTEHPPQVFYPSAPARFVLELPSGYAAAHAIGVGTQMAF